MAKSIATILKSEGISRETHIRDQIDLLNRAKDAGKFQSEQTALDRIGKLLDDLPDEWEADETVETPYGHLGVLPMADKGLLEAANDARIARPQLVKAVDAEDAKVTSETPPVEN